MTRSDENSHDVDALPGDTTPQIHRWPGTAR